MKHHGLLLFHRIRGRSLPLLAILLSLVLSACSSYAPTRSYPASHYSYPASARYYQSNYSYYGAYQPGWFVMAPYFPGNYWGTGGMVYWPTYSSSYYYRNQYYGRHQPYFDPWYYPFAGQYRRPYGHYYGPYYGGVYGAGYWPSAGRPYYGSSYSYRPPGRPEDPRPDPVVIPPGDRGGNGPGEGYNDAVDDALRQRDRYQPERRSATVVVEREGMTQSVGVAPGQDGQQGMVISNRSERKIQPDRMHPVPAEQSAVPAYREQIVAPTVAPSIGEQQPGKYTTRSRIPRQPAATVMPTTRNNVEPVNTSPGRNYRTMGSPAINSAVVTPAQGASAQVSRGATRSNPAPTASQPNSPAPASAFQPRPEPDNAVPRAERRQYREVERGQERQRDQSEQ